MQKRPFVLLLAWAAAVCFTGCAQTAGETGVTPAAAQTASSEPSSSEAVSADSMFTDRDMEIGYEERESAAIALNGSSAACDDSRVSISGSTVTITGEGTYLLSGSLSNGQIVIDAEKTDKLHLVLNGVDINCDTSAAIYVKQADKVFVTLAADTENKLSNQSEFVAIDDNNIDSVIFSKEDLTLNGLGSLTIHAAYGHGIVSKDDLVVTSGTYEINAASHGLCGKDSVRISSGTFAITSGKDGIHAENADDTSLGFLYIAGGDFTVNAQTDGFDAASALQIQDGKFVLTTGGGSANASTKQDGSVNPDWGFWGREDTSADEEAASSAKGLKADRDLTVNGGVFQIDSSDDCIHSNSNVSICGGTFQLLSGDDGIHADTQTTISGGALNIEKSYEGIEGQIVSISGGEISLAASDDGINAAGGSDQSSLNVSPGMDNFTSSVTCRLEISGGRITIDAGGDGIDSNGPLAISGGEVYVSGPTSGADGALDYDGDGSITGGIIVAAGSSQMAQNFGSSSTQGVMLVNFTTQAANSQVALTDAGGNLLVSFSPAKEYSSVIVSCPQMAAGETYTLTAGSETQTIELTQLVYGSGGMMGGGMGGQPPGGMEPPGGNRW